MDTVSMYIKKRKEKQEKGIEVKSLDILQPLESRRLYIPRMDRLADS
jgi:hypothetical protein